MNWLITYLKNLLNRGAGAPVSVGVVEGETLHLAEIDSYPLEKAEMTQINTVPCQKTDFTVSFGTFNGFDSSLGTLISVTATLTATATHSGKLTNTSLAAQTFTFATNNQTFISGGPVPLMAAFGGSTPLRFSSQTLFYDLAAHTTMPVPVSGSSGFTKTSVTSQNTFSDALHLAAFENGTFSVNLASLTGKVFGGQGSNITAILDTEVSGALAITYRYDVTVVMPSPAAEHSSLLGQLIAGEVGRELLGHAVGVVSVTVPPGCSRS